MGRFRELFSHFTLMEGEKNPEKKRNVFYCENCDYSTSVKFSFDRHNLTQKHLLQIMGEKKPQKKGQIFYCENCNFITSNKKDFERHSSTRKHLESKKPEEKGQYNVETIDAVDTSIITEKINNLVINNE